MRYTTPTIIEVMNGLEGVKKGYAWLEQKVSTYGKCSRRLVLDGQRGC